LMPWDTRHAINQDMNTWFAPQVRTSDIRRYWDCGSNTCTCNRGPAPSVEVPLRTR